MSMDLYTFIFLLGLSHIWINNSHMNSTSRNTYLLFRQSLAASSESRWDRRHEVPVSDNSGSLFSDCRPSFAYEATIASRDCVGVDIDAVNLNGEGMIRRLT